MKENNFKSEMQGKREVTILVNELSVKVTQENVDDIMTTALEGGINHWCHLAEHKEGEATASEKEPLGIDVSGEISRGGTLVLCDDYCDQNTLTLENFLHGLKLWAEEGHDEYNAINNGEIDCGMIDSIGADGIIQYAIFEIIVFD